MRQGKRWRRVFQHVMPDVLADPVVQDAMQRDDEHAITRWVDARLEVVGVRS
jgi:hypothetical protein